jgi:hypothetical protein
LPRRLASRIGHAGAALALGIRRRCRRHGFRGFVSGKRCASDLDSRVGNVGVADQKETAIMNTYPGGPEPDDDDDGEDEDEAPTTPTDEPPPIPVQDPPNEDRPHPPLTVVQV